MTSKAIITLFRFILTRGIKVVWRYPCHQCNVRQGICNADVVFHPSRISNAVHDHVTKRWNGGVVD